MSKKNRNCSQMPITKGCELKQKDLLLPFYPAEITLTSFLDGKSNPFTQQSFDDPSSILNIGVLGNDNCGKTTLINELSINLEKSQSNAKIHFNGQCSHSIYYKSVITDSVSKLIFYFIKAPSMNNYIYESQKYSFSELYFDRLIMKKFVIGYFAWFCDILIIIVDSHSETEYEKYYYEIKQIRSSVSNLYIIHNFSKYNKKEKKELLKRLDNDKLFNKNIFTVFNSKMLNKDIEYYYVNKNDSSIIHMIYDPKTQDELKKIYDPTFFKPNNTKMIYYLISYIQICHQKEKKKIKGSLDKYYQAFVKQLHTNAPFINNKLSNNENQSLEHRRLNLITDSFININVLPRSNIPSFYYCIQTKDKQKYLVIDLDISITAQIKQLKNTIVGENILLCYCILQEIDKKLDNNQKPSFEYSNLSQEYTFEIRIPAETCLIKNKTPKKEIFERQIRLLYELHEEDEDQVIEFV